MRRSAAFLAVSILIVIAGCKGNKNKEAAYQTPADQMNLYADTGSLDTGTAYDKYAVEPAPIETYTADSAYQPAEVGTRYHTVQKKETLYSLARTYYGDQRRWKDIYQANKSSISDPNKIFVGQRLLIP